LQSKENSNSGHQFSSSENVEASMITATVQLQKCIRYNILQEDVTLFLGLQKLCKEYFPDTNLLELLFDTPNLSADVKKDFMRLLSIETK
ncbi:hypothetical protein N9E48_10955, partial [Paracoccaceae bacterium]|nr:hypothetical protein [Paracoccaceae bacterium]